MPDEAGSPHDEDVVDELPEDLHAAGYVGPYLFPDNNRRRIPGYLYLATAAACVAVWLLVDDSPYVNGGFLFAVVLLAIVGAYQLVTAWSLDVDEQDALVAASRTVGSPVGHASAQMGWRGRLSRPTRASWCIQTRTRRPGGGWCWWTAMTARRWTLRRGEPRGLVAVLVGGLRR